jgi:hypothetical protein
LFVSVSSLGSVAIPLAGLVLVPLALQVSTVVLQPL